MEKGIENKEKGVKMKGLKSKKGVEKMERGLENKEKGLEKMEKRMGKMEKGQENREKVWRTLEIDDEDDQYELVDFFLKYKAQEVALGQSWGSRGGEDLTYPGGNREDDGFGGHRVKLKASQSSQGSLPAVAIQPDDVLKILKVFVQDFSKLRSLRLKDGAGKEMLQVRDSSKDGEYWESLAQVIPEATLKLWDALAVALEEYYKVLTCRANLLAEVATLDQQNTELCLLLEEYLNSGVNSSLICPPMQWMDLDLSCPKPKMGQEL
ncbi:dynein regulatory complex protein 1 [Calypte anna]|uniref:dynein regulatory complex protein 1 n=1 Tax=Calypte anna TaxID=9244 RepID=UPI0011C3674A|nr:dynein regulatory complex protein 1 [Calypte anna]